MAKDKIQEELLKQIQAFKEKGIKHPAGDHSSEEIQYKMTDMILGIVAVGMFGNKFRNIKTNSINSILGQKSLIEELNQRDKIFKEKFEVLSKNLIDNNTKTLKVSLPNHNIDISDISDNSISKISEVIKSVIPDSKLEINNVIDNTKQPKIESNENIVKVLLDINNADNFQTLVTSLENLEKVSDGDFESVKKLKEIVNLINGFVDINYLQIKNLEIGKDIQALVNDLNTIDLSQLKEISKEDKNKFESILYYLNNLPGVSIDNKLDNLKKISSLKFAESLQHVIIELNKLDLSQLKDISEKNKSNLITILSFINNLQIKSDSLQNIKLFSEANISDNIQKIINDLNKISINDINEISKENINKFNNYTILFDKFDTFIQKIQTLIDNNFSNIINDILRKNIIVKFQKIIEGLSAIDLSNIKKINNENYLSKYSDTFIKLSEIINVLKTFNIDKQTLSNLQNIKDFKLNEIIQDISTIDLTPIITKMNLLNEDDIEGISNYFKYIDSISNYIKGISNIKNLDKENFDKIQDLFDNLNTLLSEDVLDVDPKKVAVLNNFSLDNFFYSIKNMDIPKGDKLTNIKNQIENLLEVFGKYDPITKKFIQVSTGQSFQNLFEAIGALVNNTGDVIGDVQGLGQIISTIFNIISFDASKINLVPLNKLLNITKSGGEIDTLFKQLNDLSQVTINQQPIRSLKDFFESISSLGEIGFKQRIRMKSNLAFFRDYLNDELPDFIKDINEKFKGIKDINDIPGLYALSNLFEMISKIGEISIKRKMRLKFNLLYIKHFVINDVIKFIQNLNTVLTEESKKSNIEEINNLLDKLLNVAELDKEKLKNSSLVMHKLHKIVYKDKFSILNLFTKINDEKETFKIFDKNIEKMSNSIDGIVSIFSNLDLNSKKLLEDLSVILTLSHIELPELARIIKKFNEIEVNSDIESKSSIIKSSYFMKINELNTYLLRINKDYDLLNSILLNIKDEIKNLSSVLKTIDVLINAYNLTDKEIFIKINNFLNTLKIDPSTLDLVKTIEALTKNIQNLSLFLQLVNELKIPKKEIIDNLSEFIVNLSQSLNDKDTLDNLFKKLIISKNTVEDFKNVKEAFKEVSKLNRTIKTVVGIGKFMGAFQSVLEKEASIINSFIRGFDDIDPKKIESATQIIKELSKLMMLSTLVLIVGAFSIKFIKVSDLLIFTGTLATFVSLMSGICISISKFFGDKNLKDFRKAVEGLMDIVIISAGILLAGGIVMKIINTGDLLLFAATLFGFVWALTLPLKTISKLDLSKLKEVASDFGKLVMILAGTLLIGSLIIKAISIPNLIKFAVSLLVFMSALWVPLKIFTTIKGEMFKGAVEFGELVLLCGLSMALGAYVVQNVPINMLIKFTEQLTLFIICLSIPLFIVNTVGDTLFESAENLGKLVLMSTAALVIGGLFMMIPGLWVESLRFAGILWAFILGISTALGIGAWLSHGNALEIGENISKLVAISAATMLLGGLLFLYIDGLKDSVIDFALVLGIFIAAISAAIGFGAWLAKEGMKNMWQISLIVLISSGVLLAAGYLMKDNPNMLKNIFGFTAAVLLLVGGLVLIARLAKIEQLWQGLISITIIGLIIYGLVYVFKEMEPLLKYDVGQLWAVSASMLGILAMFILGAAAAGALAMVLWPVLLAGVATIAIAGLLVWGLAWVFGQVIDIDKKYGVSNKGKEGIEKIVDILFDSVEYILMRLTTLKIGTVSKFTSKIPIVSLLGSVIDSLTLFPNLAMAAAGIVATTAIAYNLSLLIKYMDLVGNNPKAKVKTAGDLIEAVLGIFNRDDVKKQIKSIKDNEGLMIALKEVSKTLADVIYTLSLSIKNYSELRVPELDANGNPTGKFRPMSNKDFEDAAQNISTIITCVAGSITGLFGIGPFANKFSQDQKDVALEMLETVNTGIFGWGATKTKFGLIMEGAKLVGEVISEIAKGVIEWNKLPEGFNAELAASNIAKIITCVAGSITGLFGVGPYAKDMSQEQKDVAMEMLEVAKSGIFGWGSTKTKFTLIMEASQGIGEIINKIAEGCVEWNKLPKEFNAKLAAENIKTIITCVAGSIMAIFGVGPYAKSVTVEQKAIGMIMLQTIESGFLGLGSKKTKFTLIMEATEHIGNIIKQIAEGAMEFSKLPEGFDVGKIGTNVGTIVTCIGKALIGLYGKRIGKEMFYTNWFSGKNKFKTIADSVGKIGNLISNIMKGVQSYANLKIPTEFDKDGKPIKFAPMDHTYFEKAQENIGKIVTTLGEAVFNVGGSNLFKKIFFGSQTKEVSEAILNVSKIVGPIAEVLWMYATGKFPKLGVKDGKLEKTGIFDTSTVGGIDKVINDASSNIETTIKGLLEAIENALNDSSIKKVYDSKKLLQLSNTLTSVTTLINNIFAKLVKIINAKVSEQLVQTRIINPYTTFVKGIVPSEENTSIKLLYDMAINGKLQKYYESLDEFSKNIIDLFNKIQSIIEISAKVSPDMPITKKVMEDYFGLYTIISNFLGESYVEGSLSSIELYNKDIRSILEVVEEIDSKTHRKFNVLQEGIEGLSKVIAGIKNNKNFSDHVKNIKGYVENTNKLSLTKIQSLTNLVNAINEFGTKFGNIDDFTNAIVEKLTKSLDFLSGQLGEAKETIEKVDGLHNKRKRLIEDSVNNIKSLMEKELTVNIKEETTEDQPVGNPSGGSNSNPETTPTGGGLGGGVRGDNTSTTPTIPDNAHMTQTFNKTEKQPAKSELKPQNYTAKEKINVELDSDTIGKAIADAILKYLQNQ